jgi:alpha-amylase
MYLMVDIVANHMGGDISGISQLAPFNRPEQYHDCAGCPGDCNIHNFYTYPETEHCRLANLPDLNHQNAGVRATLLDWAAELVANYSVDGLRIDTVPEVKNSAERGG